MPRVMGVDPGFANTGIVGMEFDSGLDDSKIIHSSITITGKRTKKRNLRKSSDDQSRHANIHLGFKRALEIIKPDVVSFESISFVRNAGVMCNIGGAWYGLYYMLLTRSIYSVDYSPQELKVIATGKKTATKEAIIEAVEGKWHGQIDWGIVAKTRRDHIADAAVAAWAAVIDTAIPWKIIKSGEAT